MNTQKNKNEIIEIKEEDVGLDYLKALLEITNVRKNKRKQYHDTFLSDDILFLQYQIENKLKRLRLQIKDGNLIDAIDNIETAKDSLIDICNYSLFLIAKINLIQNDKNEK